MEAAQKLVPFTAHDLVEQYARVPRMPWWASVGLKVARIGISALLEHTLNRAYDQLSRRISERAMATQALVDTIRGGEPADVEIDADDALRERLDQVERDLAEMTEILQGMPRFEDRVLASAAADRCVLSVRAFASAARELKGAIQAHDANVATIQRVSRNAARTAEELEKQLSEIV